MLTWSGKSGFIGLVERIEAAGIGIFTDETGEHCSDEIGAQLIIDAFTLADAKAEIKARISAHAKLLRDRVISPFSPGETASWPIKRAEAAAFIAQGEAAETPFLTAESQARGVTRSAIVTRVQGNAAAMMAVEAAIAGTDGRHRDAVDALNTFDAIAAYDWSTGWPQV